MFDGWTDGKGITLLKFLVNCPRGEMFIEFVDAFAHIKDVTFLCELLDDFIQEVYVQVITNNTNNYMASGSLLMEMHPILFCTLCATHCIDLILEDMEKIHYIKDVIESTSSTMKFIFDHTSNLSLMRKFTRNKELVHPTITCFSTNIISLQSLLVVCWR
jgi:hypothetical protein